MKKLSGVYPILSLPFLPSRAIDIESLRREVDYLIGAGVHGLGLGLATEVPRLSEPERDLALTTVVDQARGRVPVVMKSDANGTDLALHYSRRAAELGADALMVMPPVPAGAAETRAYFGEIARAVQLPIVIQDVPAAPVSGALAAQIANEHEGAWYLKAESPPTPPRVAEAVAQARGRLTVFGGAHGSFFVEELRRGSQGTMPGALIPHAYLATWRLWQAGKHDQAERSFERYGPLLRLIAQPGGIGTHLVKETLRQQGIFTHAVVRGPATEADPLAYRELRAQLERLEVAAPTSA